MPRLIEQATRNYGPIEIQDLPSLEDIHRLDCELRQCQYQYDRLQSLAPFEQELSQEQFDTFLTYIDDIELVDSITLEDSIRDKIRKGVRSLQKKIDQKTREFFNQSDDKAQKTLYKSDELRTRIRRLEGSDPKDNVNVSVKDVHIRQRFDPSTVASGVQTTADTVSRVIEQFMESTNAIYDKIEDRHSQVMSNAENVSEQESFNNLEELINSSARAIADRNERFWSNISNLAGEDLAGGKQIKLAEKPRRNLPQILFDDMEDAPSASQKIDTPDFRTIRSILDAADSCAEVVQNTNRNVRQLVDRNYEMLKLADELTERLSNPIARIFRSTAGGEEGDDAAQNTIVMQTYRSKQVDSLRDAQKYLLAVSRGAVKYAEKCLEAYE